jgi:hypothetical protein
MTKEYLANLARVLSSDGQRVVFFGVQGIGYEVCYDMISGRLTFVGEKGRKTGLSGEVTNGVQPSWGSRDAKDAHPEVVEIL